MLILGELPKVDDLSTEWIKVKDDALRLLSFRPRSISELRARLKMKKHSDALVDKALAVMTEQGLLNDEQFSKMFTLSRVQSRPVGRNKIRQELTQKGISKSLIDAALAAIDPASENQSALEAAQKRLRLMGGVPLMKQKMRLFGFLRRRGFSNDAVNYAMNTCFRGLGDLE